MEDNSQNLSYAKTAKDLDELLIGEAYARRNTSLTTANLTGITLNDLAPQWHVMDDDLQEYGVGTQNLLDGNATAAALAGFHYWQPDPFRNRSEATLSTNNWRILYRSIAALNSIIYQVPVMLEAGQPADELKRINGEAHFLRAQYYFQLVNIYAKPYKPATANADLGVPLKTTPEIEDRFFGRNTLAEIYKQVVADLKQAESDLEGVTQKNLYRANQSAAQGLLSRVYLYMENYQDAITYADKVIEKPYRFYNLNNYVPDSSFTSTVSPETIFSMGGNTSHWVMTDDFMNIGFIVPMAYSYRASDDLMAIFTPQDLRRQAFFQNSTVQKERLGWKLRREANFVSDLYLIRLPEMYLNKAEAQAMLGRDGESVITIQQLRSNRFKASELTVPNVVGENLISFIRDERRRELCFESHRWFDLRRYAVNSKYPYTKKITHTSLGMNGGSYSVRGYFELKPYPEDQAAYIIPVPADVIEFNQGAILNEVRPKRSLIN